jgi:signal transduction histidine kinase
MAAALAKNRQKRVDPRLERYTRLQKDIQAAQGKIANTERRLFAAQRLSATGTLAAGIAHEINNPLGGMINAARVLREGRLDPAKQAEYLELILDGLERVRAIVQKILQFRPRTLEPRPVQLLEAVNRAIAFMDHRAKAKEVTIRNELGPEIVGSTRTVLDDHRLAGKLDQLRREQARDDVEQPARRGRHDEAYRLHWIGLRGNVDGSEREKYEGDCAHCHCSLHTMPSCRAMKCSASVAHVAGATI